MKSEDIKYICDVEVKLYEFLTLTLLRDHFLLRLPLFQGKRSLYSFDLSDLVSEG
jgi:hypothetical protein